MFHSFFNSLVRSKYLSFFSLYFRFVLWSAGTAKSTILQIFCYYYYYYYYYFIPCIVFHISVNWCFLTGIWLTISFLKSAGLFSVFRLILIMLTPRWSPLVLIVLTFQVHLPIIWGLFQVNQAQLVTHSPLSFIFLKFFSNILVLISLFAFLYFYFVVHPKGKVHYSVE